MVWHQLTHTHTHDVSSVSIKSPTYVCCLCVGQSSPHSYFHPPVRYRVFSTLLPGIFSTHHWPSSMFSITTMTTCTGVQLTSAGSPAIPTSPTAPLQTEPQASWWVWSKFFFFFAFNLKSLCKRDTETHVCVFFSSLKVFQSTLTSAASGRLLRNIKWPSSIQLQQPSACWWSTDESRWRSKSLHPLNVTATQKSLEFPEASTGVWFLNHSSAWSLSLSQLSYGKLLL